MIVFVLRHADRTEADDLKHPEGIERAELLGRMLADSGISVAFRSQYVRAEKTLARLKEQLGNALKVRTISFLDTEDAEAYGRRVADAVKALPATAVVAVVGHSDTVEPTIRSLGSGSIPEIKPHEFDKLFVLFIDPPGPGAKISTLRLRYGAAT
jgi:phosphohistidine phosphatase SixA